MKKNRARDTYFDLRVHRFALSIEIAARTAQKKSGHQAGRTRWVKGRPERVTGGTGTMTEVHTEGDGKKRWKNCRGKGGEGEGMPLADVVEKVGQSMASSGSASRSPRALSLAANHHSRAPSAAAPPTVSFLAPQRLPRLFSFPFLPFTSKTTYSNRRQLLDSHPHALVIPMCVSRLIMSSKPASKTIITRALQLP